MYIKYSKKKINNLSYLFCYDNTYFNPFFFFLLL